MKVKLDGSFSFYLVIGAVLKIANFKSINSGTHEEKQEISWILHVIFNATTFRRSGCPVIPARILLHEYLHFRRELILHLEKKAARIHIYSSVSPHLWMRK